jgi:hypothetical protein
MTQRPLSHSIVRHLINTQLVKREQGSPKTSVVGNQCTPPRSPRDFAQLQEPQQEDERYCSRMDYARRVSYTRAIDLYKHMQAVAFLHIQRTAGITEKHRIERKRFVQCLAERRRSNYSEPILAQFRGVYFVVVVVRSIRGRHTQSRTILSLFEMTLNYLASIALLCGLLVLCRDTL